MNKCGHDNCFTCPFADCIVDDWNEVVETEWKRGRKPLTPEERKARRREVARNYYQKNKEAINKRHRANYHKRKEREAATA